MLIESLMIGLWLTTPAAPTSAQTEVKGPASDKVLAAINKHAPEVDACVKRYLAEVPGAKGKAQLKLNVGAAGRVKRSRASTTGLKTPRSLVGCLEMVSMRWHFPKPKQPPGTVQVPIIVQENVPFWVGPRPKKRDDRR